MISNPVIYKFFKDFNNHRKNTNMAAVFSSIHFSNILNKGTTDETFQKSGKQDSFRHFLKSSASVYENSGSQFFKTTSGKQSGPDVFDESRFVLTFFNHFGSYRNIMHFQISSRMENR